KSRGGEQRATCRVLDPPLLGSHPPIAVRHASVAHAKRVHHSVSIQGVVSSARWELRIRSDAVESAVQLPGNRAFDNQVRVVALHSDWREPAGHKRARKRTVFHVSPPTPTELVRLPFACLHRDKTVKVRRQRSFGRATSYGLL